MESPDPLEKSVKAHQLACPLVKMEGEEELIRTSSHLPALVVVEVECRYLAAAGMMQELLPV